MTVPNTQNDRLAELIDGLSVDGKSDVKQDEYLPAPLRAYYLSLQQGIERAAQLEQQAQAMLTEAQQRRGALSVFAEYLAKELGLEGVQVDRDGKILRQGA